MARFEWNKVILPLTVISVVGLILFPIPSQLLDLLLAANFSFCVVLLISSVFVSEPDKFTSLPTILLLGTLFRLGLNVSSTRLILSGHEVPEIIISFGQFVVAGSTIVGLVIFSIISIIQFIVIAKGSERVAEVAARFTLDALPGKQMSIDADMRAGLISLSEAREKRKDLHRESKLYGALDGAMKFVKGDAIVGLCIIFVNIFAGFIIGVTRDGLSVSKALEQYTLFTVGDGLISQIPAVLVSIAAGIIVTRVSEKDGGQLADEIGSQISSEPLTLLISGILLLILACMPGLPLAPFAATSIVPILFWYKQRNQMQSNEFSPESFPFKPKLMPPITLRLSALGAQQLQSEGKITNYFDALRAMVFEENGIILPELSFDIDPLERQITCEILINGQLANKLKFFPDKAIPGCIDSWSRCVGGALKEEIYNRRSIFITDSHTRNLLDLYEHTSSDIIRTVIPDKISVTALTLIMRNLVAEMFCIRDVGTILQTLGEIFETDKTENIHSGTLAIKRSLILVAVRKNLIRSYLLKILDNEKELNCFLIDEDMEEKISSHLEADLPLHPNLINSVRVFSEAVKNHSSYVRKTAFIMTSSKIRLAVFEAVSKSNSDVFVLSRAEIPEDFQININYLPDVNLYEEAA